MCHIRGTGLMSTQTTLRCNVEHEEYVAALGGVAHGDDRPVTADKEVADGQRGGRKLRITTQWFKRFMTSSPSLRTHKGKNHVPVPNSPTIPSETTFPRMASGVGGD